jgi:hypothetical protein
VLLRLRRTRFSLIQGVTAQIVSIWTNLILLRGLMPVTANSSGYETPPWYSQRGVRCSVRFSGSAGDGITPEQFEQAREWTNRAFVLRMVATLEAFLPGRKRIHKFLLPNLPGMREWHHARQLRNAIAHGDLLDDPKDVREEAVLFRRGTHGATECKLAINDVLEPLWARLLMFARRVEVGAGHLPPNPAVVAARFGDTLVVQTPIEKREIPLGDADPRLSCKIGEVTSLDV